MKLVLADPVVVKTKSNKQATHDIYIKSIPWLWKFQPIIQVLSKNLLKCKIMILVALVQNLIKNWCQLYRLIEGSVGEFYEIRNFHRDSL